VKIFLILNSGSNLVLGSLESSCNHIKAWRVLEMKAAHCEGSNKRKISCKQNSLVIFLAMVVPWIMAGSRVNIPKLSRIASSKQEGNVLKSEEYLEM
jgi:hypothetical protein